ncbi:unnamed protein product [Spirodela intermedia]|uniref:Uncharacterized protein n=1 Tax=Spirodela intermedia TaxID=51605 RepID=A0A7I8IW87_SPIIN|nr:unnamed protein product [Spirodela intermedia]CAA6662238.1 unnamed protein product [Spirodela intermedia]
MIAENNPVWPNLQLEGATLLASDCQLVPQFRVITCHPVLDPLIHMAATSPAPATFVTSTNSK